MRQLLFGLVTIACGTAMAAPEEVKIETGRLKGTVQEGVVSFKGIPFAAPPVGDLRWRAPQPAKPWSGVREASAYGADCMQKPFPGDAAPLGVEPAEDCLYANVWTPSKPASKKMAVMVWIYGGGFVNGGSSPAVYDGSQFAKRGVVFVSFNYRVGRFGFFAHPALTKETPNGPLGNYGYMDQIAALQWVKRNVGAFGGDPGNVTLFGESAGGGSVLTMMTSPLAKGLIHKAVIESGGGRTMLMGPRTLQSAEGIGVAFAKSVNVSGDDAAALKALRALPADAVTAGLNMATMMTPTYSGPMVDSKLVVEPPDAAYSGGRGAKIPTMAGATSMDIGFGRWRTKDELFAQFAADKDAAIKAYDPDGSLALMGLGMTVAADQMMVEPARHTVRTIAAAGRPAYHFRFSYVAESMRKEWKGAPHATEIPFVFDTVAARYGKQLTAADKATAEAANAYWVNFANTGNPNGKGLPEWPAYTRENENVLDFSNGGPVLRSPDPWKIRLDLTEKVATQKSGS